MADQDLCEHKFQPRYNKVYTTNLEQMLRSGLNHMKNYDFEDFDSYLQQEIYIYDICIKCRLTVAPSKEK